MWAASLVAMAAFLFTSHVWAVEDFMAKRVFLKTPASFVNLTSEAWKVHDRNVEITLAIRFQPNTKVGQVFSLRAIDQHGKKTVKLVGSLHSGYLQIDLFNRTGDSILNKPFTTHFLDQNVEHSLAIRINTGAKTLSYRLESTPDHVCEITEDINLQDAEVVPTLGGGGNSMIGCVTLITVEVGWATTAPHHVIPIASNEIDECSEANECAHRDCNKGRCIELEVATCDCYGTEKSGPNCRYPARTVFVMNNDDESQPSHIRYIPWNVDQTISRITIDFKFAELDNKQGVLLYSVLDDGSVVKLFVVEGNGNLLFGNLGHMNFTLDPTQEFHSIFIGIHHGSRTIGLAVDGQSQKLVLQDSSVSLKLSSMLFGGAPTTNGTRELGITACLKNVYVNHYDIIYMMYDKDKRVESSKVLGPCNHDGSLSDLFASGVPMFSADPMPNELSETLPLQHGINLVDDGPPIIKTDGEPVVQHLAASIGDSVHKAGLFNAVQTKDPAPCEKSQDYVCRNGATCERRSGNVVCICRRGFGGRYCQFVLHPRTCAEARTFHDQSSGPTQLDVDGSRPLLGSVAVCREGTTVVPHDMPNGTVIRSSYDPTDAMFIISYRDFSNEKLARLIQNSGSCQQQVYYVCSHAALRFESKRTWFQVAVGNRTVRQIGRVPDSCPCMDMGCIENKKCNCDSLATMTGDTGYLYGQDAGVIRVVAMYSEGDVDGKLTLGPLECEGFAAAAPIRFAEPRALPVRDWNGEPISLQFRTALPSATLLSVQESAERYFKVELISGHMIRVSLFNSSASVESQARLNDTKWHLLVLEIANDEIRLSIDNSNTFTAIPETAVPKGTLQLNDDDSGFTGCIRSLIINDEAIDVQAIGKGVEDVHPYCDDRCHENFCQNAAECIEDFAQDSAVCRCRYPNVHSGRNCEIDINQNSSVSFHGGFLKYELSQNALMEQTVLSFRTDQSQALILFVHDHNNNFMQLHLSEEVNLTLSLNNDDIVSSCTVRARDGSEFGNMEWIQKFINVFTDIVIIPVGLNSPADPKPFLYTFIGGIERESHSTDGSMLLRPIYQCAVPNLLGCMRGVRVGDEVVDLRHAIHDNRPNDPNLVRSGCDMGCATLDCRNGGHCSVAWRGVDGKVVCDCSRTSYAGPHCTIDEGLTFDSNAHFTFDIGRFLSRYILTPQKLTQKLQFAFAPKSPSTTHQTLATVSFADNRLFEVILNKNGSVNVGIVNDGKKPIVRTFAGNFSNGYRHFFSARFGAHQATSVTVDAVRHDFDFMADNLDLYNAKEITLGGREIDKDEPHVTSSKDKYSGCISNLDINYGVPALHLTPISYLDDSFPSMANYSRLSSGVIVPKGACAPFQIQNVLPVFREPVELPVWETNFKRLVYKEGNNEAAGGEEGKFWLWTLCIVISLMVILLIATVITCCCFLFSSRSNDKPMLSKDEEEAQPLRGTPLAPPPSLIEESAKSSPKRVVISEPLNKSKPDDANLPFELKPIRTSSPLAPIAMIDEADSLTNSKL
nr:Laminin G and EGF domain containing protein [Haemonchus contortus]